MRLGTLAAHLTLRAALYPYLIRTSPRQTCLGIEVADLTNDEADPQPYFAKVTAALEIIAKHEPRRLDRIRRDLRHIVIFKQPGAAYWVDIAACALPPSIASNDAEDVALTIVHEATHARIRSRGIPYNPAQQARNERICVNEEVFFTAFLADGAERAAKRIARLEAPWWTAVQLRDWKFETLRRNAPPWLARLLIWLHPPL